MTKHSKLPFLLFTLLFVLGSFSNPAALATDLTGRDLNYIDQGLEWYPDNLSSCTTLVVGGNTNAEIAFNYLLTKGLVAEQAAGVVGNLQAESGVNPKIIQGGGTITDPYSSEKREGRGIAQWETTGRWKELLKYAKDNNLDPLDIITQLDFLWYELTTKPGLGLEELKEAQNIRQATWVFLAFFERPGSVVDSGLVRSVDQPTERQKAYDTLNARSGLAQNAYDDFAGTAGSGITQTTQCTDTGKGVVFDVIVGDTTDTPCQGNFTKERTDFGYQGGKKYSIRICQMELPNGEGGPWVNSIISQLVSDMIEAAGGDGIILSGGGFRTMEDQLTLRENNNCPDIYESPAEKCEPPTARPGYSNHQMGLAIDFRGIDKVSRRRCQRGEIWTVRQETRSNSCILPGNEVWEWLTDNARSFGMYQLYSEVWHWSVNGR